jgi:hypothetical protein
MRVRRAALAEPRGAALVEVLVAFALLAGAGCAGVQLVAWSMRALWVSSAETRAAILAEQKLHDLRGLTWTVGADGQPISDFTTTLAVDPPASGGSGLAPSPPGTLEDSVPGFVDYLDDDGRWVGTGTLPPPSAAFVRRWAIVPLAVDPDHTVVLQVLVAPMAAGASTPRTPGRRAPGEALVTSALTRAAR